ncbi:uncharacterized protein MONOS_17504 [Monocercomonoides exilis]|uniref:uncharacterized protein n=1 Tax=Monocercomonoides exilis TaxID=2049356 RepID=UPI00355A0A9E|nr:hypothetical protein MONOS_17504 [Monocercomonoides exilis]
MESFFVQHQYRSFRMPMTKIVKTPLTENFTEIFSRIKNCSDAKQKILFSEISEVIERMNETEFNSVISKDLFNEIDKIIEKKTILFENALLLLKIFGKWKVFKEINNSCFIKSILHNRIESLILEEKKENEKKNTNFLIDLYECYLLLKGNHFHEKATIIIVPCLAEFALNKDKNPRTQKEVEFALLALGNIPSFPLKIEKDWYLKEMVEIMKYHQEHHNLTHLAYQSSWRFVLNRFKSERIPNDKIVNEFHFAREIAKEIKSLTACVDWKKKKEEKKKTKEQIVIDRWFKDLQENLFEVDLWNEENAELTESLAMLFKSSKDNYVELYNQCFDVFTKMINLRRVLPFDLLKGGVIVTVMEDLQQPTLPDSSDVRCMSFFVHLSRKMNKKMDDESDEKQRKLMKGEILQKLEEEGYEDEIASLLKLQMNIFLHQHSYDFTLYANDELSLMLFMYF